MVTDVYEASWNILQNLLKHSSMKANPLFLKTKKIGSKATFYKALDILLEEDLIKFDENKAYSINADMYFQQDYSLQAYYRYEEVTDRMDNLLSELNEKLKDHRPVLQYTESDKNLAKDILKQKQYAEIIDFIVDILRTGTQLDFVLSCDLMSKTFEKKALSLRRKNENAINKYLKMVLNHEPILWGEILTLIQARLATRISPA